MPLSVVAGPGAVCPERGDEAQGDRDTVSLGRTLDGAIGDGLKKVVLRSSRRFLVGMEGLVEIDDHDGAQSAPPDRRAR